MPRFFVPNSQDQAMSSAEKPKPTIEEIDEFAQLLAENCPQVDAEQKLSILAHCRATLPQIEAVNLQQYSQSLKEQQSRSKVANYILQSLGALFLLTVLIVVIPYTFITGHLEEPGSLQRNFLEHVSNYHTEHAREKFSQKLSYQETLLHYENCTELIKEHPGDIRFLAHHLACNPGTAPLELYQEARKQDPTNAWLTSLHAAVLLERGQPEQAFRLLRVASQQDNFHRYPDEIQNLRVRLHTENNFGADLHRINTIQSSQARDLGRLRNLAYTATRFRNSTAFGRTPDSPSLNTPILTLYQNLNSLNLPLSETHKTAISAHKNLGILVPTTLSQNQQHPEEGTRLQLAHNKYAHLTVKPSFYKLPFHFSAKTPPPDYWTNLSLRDEELTPGNRKHLLAIERTYAGTASPLLLPLATLFLILSLFGSLPSKTLALATQPLFSLRRIAFAVALSSLLPLLFYILLTRFTPLGHRDHPPNQLYGQPILIQLHLTLFLIFTTSLAVSKWMVHRTLAPLQFCKKASLWFALPSLLLVVAFICKSCVPVFPLRQLAIFDSTVDWLIISAFVVVLIQLFRGLTSAQSTAVTRILICRNLCLTLAVTSLLLVALIPILFQGEVYWSKKDNFRPPPHSSVHANTAEEEVAQKIRAELDDLLNEFSHSPLFSQP